MRLPWGASAVFPFLQLQAAVLLGLAVQVRFWQKAVEQEHRGNQLEALAVSVEKLR